MSNFDILKVFEKSNFQFRLSSLKFLYLTHVLAACPPVPCAVHKRHRARELLVRQGGLRLPRTSGAVRNRAGVHFGGLGSVLLPVPRRDGIYCPIKGGILVRDCENTIFFRKKRKIASK